MSELLIVDRELRQAIAELGLISHAATQSFDQSARDTSDEPGGRRPGGSDVDRPGRSATIEEKAAWWESYHRKTPAWFRVERQKALDRESVQRLIELRDDCGACREAWRKRPITKGQAPDSMRDSNWKQYIATSDRDSGDLAREYGCTRRYINKIKAMNWSAREAA